MNAKIIRNIEKINFVLEKVSIFLMLFLLFLTFANVVGRYVFSRSIFFADEMARFIFVWIVFLGIAKIVKDKRQVAVTLLSDRLSDKKSGFVLESFIALCGLVFLIIVFLGGIKLSRTMMFYSSAALTIPMGIVYLAIPIGSGLTVVFHVLNYIETVLEFIEKRKALKPEALK